MELQIKTFRELTTEELYEILRTREAVFIVEQNCPYPEADAIGFYQKEGFTVTSAEFLEDGIPHVQMRR